MKYLFFTMTAFLLGNNAYSKGYDCEALCIVLDSARSTLYFVGEMNFISSSTKKETHRLLKKQCQIIAKQSGLSSPAMLVDSLDFKSRTVNESENSSSVSSSQNGWVSVGESRASGPSVVYASYQVDLGASRSNSSSSYSRKYEDRELDIRISPSRADMACEEDENVSDGEIPYQGGIIIN